MGLYRRAATRIGHTPMFASVYKRIGPPIDRFVYRLTGGKRVFAPSFVSTFILIHTGARSGRTYRTPLSYVRVGDGFALAGSNFGQAHHPAWSANLMANPEAAVDVGGRTIRVRARLADAAEQAELWPRFVGMWPPYDTYRNRTTRNIRVFVLEPTTS